MSKRNGPTQAGDAWSPPSRYGWNGRLTRWVVGLFTIALLSVQASVGKSQNIDFAARLSEVIEHVEAKFYVDPFSRPDYRNAKDLALQQIQHCQQADDFRQIVNGLLRSLEASHTYYMTPDDWEFYQLAGVFAALPDIKALFHDQPITMPSIGVIVQRLEDQWIVADVMPGGAAQAGGLQIGDILVDVGQQAYSPVAALKPHVNQPTPFRVQRGGRSLVLTLTPRMVQPQSELLEAVQSSISVTEHRGHKIGYVHFYSYAGREFHEVLEQAITAGSFREAAALVVDLRYGLGGANAAYLNVFNSRIPQLTMLDRSGQESVMDSQWRKPVVFLINETSRSGKEVLAFGAKKHGMATLVGTKTAGAVLAGTPIVIGEQDLLYLAVRDVVVDDQRIEGQGVEPDVVVPMNLLKCQGVDLQRQSAMDTAASLVDTAALDR